MKKVIILSLFGFSLFLLILDRFTKKLFLTKQVFYSSQLIKLQLSKNKGLYFLNINKNFLLFISGIIILFLIYLLLKALAKKDYFVSIGLFLIIMGGLNNLLDRILYGYVIDWLWVIVWPIAVINLADVMISLGLVLMFFTWFKRKNT